MTDPILIVGAGQAGIKAAETLRQKGYDGDLVMFGDEAFLPYQRPPLSKAYLKGEMDEERLFLRPEAYFETASVELRTQTSVASIDPAAKTHRAFRRHPPALFLAAACDRHKSTADPAGGRHA